MKSNLIWVLAIAFCSCTTSVTVDHDEQEMPNADEIHNVMNGWHEAAANADYETYFNYFENDSSIFMGTDATERWTIAEFKPFSKPYFDRGQAWNFKALQRNVFFSENGKTAWFDEVLDTPNLGPCRGTGVLVSTQNGWKIAHYNLSITIPNELVDKFLPQIDSVLSN